MKGQGWRAPGRRPADEVLMASVARTVTVAALLFCSALQAQAAVLVKNLQVEYRDTCAAAAFRLADGSHGR
jgi:hypothetical protein